MLCCIVFLFYCLFCYQELQDKLKEMSSNVMQVSRKGDTLSSLVGESQQPIVSMSMSGVNTDYQNLAEAWKQKYDQLQAALNETNQFQTDLVAILNYLQGNMLTDYFIYVRSE